MVGLIIFAIGIIGFGGMTLVISRGNRQARATDDAGTLAQSAIEDIAGVTWATLGSDVDLSNGAPNGLNNALVRTEGPLNRLGQTLGTGSGPYSYYRHLVVCPPSPTTGYDQAAGSTPIYCGGSLSGNNRPSELACSTISPALTSREKLVRVIVGNTDKAGNCHWKHVDSLAFNW